MTREEIKHRVETNLESAGLHEADIRVQSDLGDGWAIVVISSGFEGMDLLRRRTLALDGLTETPLSWVDLMTPGESEWAGVQPGHAEGEVLPLWPESLDRGERMSEGAKSSPVFASDLEEDLEPPVAVTFYSLRGGVGRSTALVYTGRILAERGRKVVCVDMDLEAPGLAALFGREHEVTKGMGLAHVLCAIDQGEKPDLAAHLIRVSDTDDLYCLPAGHPDADYARALRYLDPAAWYREERNPLHLLMHYLGQEMPFKPDVLLFDARTGITSLSAPLLFDLADLAVIVFYPHPQALAGTKALTRALLGSRTRRLVGGRHLTPEPRFLVSPIPPGKAPEVIRRYRDRPLDWIADWLSPVQESSSGEEFNPSEIAHFVPYREVIATSDSSVMDKDVWREYEPVAGWVERFLPSQKERSISVSVAMAKDAILSELRFSSGTAEDQADFDKTFVQTEMVRKAIHPGIPLVLGRKGTGKTAIFRHLAEGRDIRPILVVSPPRLRRESGWMLGADGYAELDAMLSRGGIPWRQYWTLQVCLAMYFSLRQTEPGLPRPEVPFGQVLGEMPQSERALVELFRRFFEIEGVGLFAGEWLDRLDRHVAKERILLFDGLDTGFGSSDDERSRRRRALEGLFSFLIERSDTWRNLRLKVLLREDIWKRLKFENKSHLFGRTVTLKWNDIAPFLKIALKQAVQSSALRNLVYMRHVVRGGDVDEWQEPEVFAVWDVLVGERMKGGKTAFTRNWVWNRLADGNEDHSPRYLLQLMDLVTEWEKREHLQNSYDRSIIRPRALTSVLPEVSQRALSALRDEEYQELQGLLAELTEIGRTPFDATSLDSVPVDLVGLAREVGLLGVYTGSEEKVERYKVPDLFRSALNMTRKGQQ